MGSRVPKISPASAWLLGGLLVSHLNPLPLSGFAQDPRFTSTKETAESHVGRGYELVKDERYGEAAEEFKAALRIRPDLIRARYQLAVCWFALSRLKDSRREFEQLRRETHDDPAVLYYLGRLDLLEGNIEDAIQELSKLVHSPPFPDTAYYLGFACLKKGDLEKAEKWLQESAKGDPHDFRVPDHLARIYQKQGRTADAEKQYALSSQLRGHYNEASQVAVACSRELEGGSAEESSRICQQLFDPNDPDRLTTLGMLYGQHAHFAEGVAPLEQAAQLDPESFEIQHNLGLTFFRLKRYREALAPLEKAVALRPDFFGSNALLGATLYALGEDDSSYRVLRHAHELNPQDRDSSDLLFKVAVILARREYSHQKYESALRFLSSAGELRPDDPDVRQRIAEVNRLLHQIADEPK